jgi:hypothetical protein
MKRGERLKFKRESEQKMTRRLKALNSEKPKLN